jgi:hypothetical protein
MPLNKGAGLVKEGRDIFIMYNRQAISNCIKILHQAQLAPHSQKCKPFPILQ